MPAAEISEFHLCRHNDGFRSISCLRLAGELIFGIHHKRCWQTSGFSEFSITSVGRCHDLRNLTLTVLTDWQILKFCIVVVDRCPNFQNSALQDFYKIELSGDSALLNFRRMKIPRKLHCLFRRLFSQNEINQRIYIINRQCHFSEIARSV